MFLLQLESTKVFLFFIPFFRVFILFFTYLYSLIPTPFLYTFLMFYISHLYTTKLPSSSGRRGESTLCLWLKQANGCEQNEKDQDWQDKLNPISPWFRQFHLDAALICNFMHCIFTFPYPSNKDAGQNGRHWQK